MIRAKLEGGPFLFGVDMGNMIRLMQGQPIRVDLRTMGGTDEFIIIFGPTYQDILQDIAKAAGVSVEELMKTAQHTTEVPEG